MLGLNWKSKPPDLGNPSELTEIESDIRIVMKSTRNLSKGPYPNLYILRGVVIKLNDLTCILNRNENFSKTFTI